MLNNISNDDHILNNSIAQQAKLAGVEKKSTSANPYSKVAEQGDVLEISDQAKKLYERDKEIQKYKSMVMDSLDSPVEPDEMQTILDSIKSNEYVSNEAIAEKMLSGDITLNNSELLQILFSDTNIAHQNPFSDLLDS